MQTKNLLIKKGIKINDLPKDFQIEYDRLLKMSNSETDTPEHKKERSELDKDLFFRLQEFIARNPNKISEKPKESSKDEDKSVVLKTTDVDSEKSSETVKVIEQKEKSNTGGILLGVGIIGATLALLFFGGKKQ